MATEFQVAAAPGMALAGSIDKVFGALAQTITDIKEAERVKRQEQDALNITHKANINDLEGILKLPTDARNIELALNLFKIGSAEQTQELNRHIASTEHRFLQNTRKAEADFFAQHGLSLLDSLVTPKLEVRPKVTRIERTQKLREDGTLSFDPEGKPIFEDKETIVSEVESEDNPLRKIIEQYKKAGTTPPPEVIEKIAAMNDLLKKEAAHKSQQAGLDVRAGEAARRAGINQAGQAGLEVVKQQGRESLANLTGAQRTAIAAQQAASRWDVIQAQLAGRNTLAEKQVELKKQLELQDRNLQERLAWLSRGYTVKTTPDGMILRDANGNPELVRAPNGEPLIVADADAIADNIKNVTDRTYIQAIMQYQKDSMDFGEKIPGKSRGAAYWSALSGLSEEGIAGFATRQKNEFALYVLLVNKFMDANLMGAIPSEQALTPTLEDIKITAGVELTYKNFMKFLEEARGTK